jgi:hypothetical protein
MRKVLVLSHGVNNANPSFCAGKKIIKGEACSWFPNLLLLKASLTRLDFGPAYYEDPISRTSSFSLLGSRGSYVAAFPGPFFSASTRSDSLTHFPWIRWLRSSSLKNGTALVHRQARSDLGCSTLES